MKHISICFLVIMAIVVSGCASKPYKPPSFTIKNLDYVDRMLQEVEKKSHPQQTIVIRANPPHISITPYFTPLSNDLKFIIDPNTELGIVGGYMKGLVHDRRLEFWTRYGIYIVSAPNYSGRRLPPFGKNDIDLRILVKKNTFAVLSGENRHIKTTADLQEAISIIFDEISKADGFKNVSFIFNPDAKWKEAELIMALLLQRIDSMRGFWLGKQKDDNVRMHFHDIESIAP